MTIDHRYIKPDALEKLRETVINLFSTGQFHEVGMRTICSQAKVSPQTVYKYFGNKDQLLLACMEKDMQYLADICVEASKDEPNTLKALEKFSHAFFNFYYNNAFIARIIYLNIPSIYWSTKSSPAREALASALATLIQQGVKEKTLKKNGSIELIVDIITGAGNRIITRWLANGEKDDLVKQGKQSMNLLLNGMSHEH